MSIPEPSLSDLPPDDRRALESWLKEFDRSWEDGRLSRQVRLLPPAGSPTRFATLVELVKIDLRRRWQSGIPETVEAYLDHYPELGAPDAPPFGLIEAEYHARRQCGQP